MRSTATVLLAVLFMTTLGYAQNIEGVVSIKGDLGTYLSVCTGCQQTNNYNNPSFNSATVHARNTNDWSTHFTITRLANGNYTIQTERGGYMTLCSGCIKLGTEKDFITFHATSPESSAQFRIRQLSNGKYTIQSAHTGKYVTRCNACSPTSTQPNQVTAHVASVDMNTSYAQWEIQVIRPASGTGHIPPSLGAQATATAAPVAISSSPAPAVSAGEFSSFLLHTGTALGPANHSCRFLVGDYDRDGKPDIYFILKNNTGSNKTEVHVLSGASNFSQFILHTGTALEMTDQAYDFALADYDHDGKPDLYAIKKNNTGTNMTEVHILSGASNFSQFILHTGTGLHVTDQTFDFVIGDYDRDGKPDIYAIKKSNTGTNKTEVHILSGASNYGQFLTNTGTALEVTDKTYEFALGDYDRDGKPDLYVMKKSNTGTNTTEIHILSGASNYAQFIQNTGSGLELTNENFTFDIGDYNADGKPDIYAIKKYNTGTNMTEVHILNAAK